MRDSNQSERIVTFLANLAHFQGRKLDNDVYAAQRITDGTIFAPHYPEDEDGPEGLLTVFWQGDPQKAEAVVIGTQIAEHEIITAVKHWVTIGEMDDERGSIEHLFQHFTYKTGAKLRFQKEDKVFANTLGKLLQDLGWTAFKRFVGL